MNTQNSEVMIVAKTLSYLSISDKRLEMLFTMVVLQISSS